LRPPISTVSLPPATFSIAFQSSRRAARCWSKYAIVRPVPGWIVPVSGVSWPSSNRSNVVLPLPLGPTRPTRSPRRIFVEKSRTIGRPS
jgi:hypothetical protein